MNDNTYAAMRNRPSSKKSSLPVYAVGTVIVAGTVLLSVFGSTAAINYLNNEANAKVTAAQNAAQSQYEDDWLAKLNEKESEIEELEKRLSTLEEKYGDSTTQLDWAHDHNVTWDENGFPRNGDGLVIDDPTTEVNEITRYEEFRELQKQKETNESESEPESEPQSEPTPDSNPTPDPKLNPDPDPDSNPDPNPESTKPWWDGDSRVEESDDGYPVYTVKSGDYLLGIANMFDVSSDDIIKLNGISNPSVIVTGTKLKLPKTTLSDDSVVNGASGAGRG